MSNRYHQSTYSVIACVSADENHKKNYGLAKGLILEDPLRKKLLKNISQVELHASLIKLLTKEICGVEEVVICSDVDPVNEVVKKLSEEVKGIKFKSIEMARYELNSYRKSAADNFAHEIKRKYYEFKNDKKIFDDVKLIEIDSEEYNFILNNIFENLFLK